MGIWPEIGQWPAVIFSSAEGISNTGVPECVSKTGVPIGVPNMESVPEGVPNTV